MTTKKAPEPESEVSNDVETLAPDDDSYTMVSGTKVNVKPLKTRELFKLLKIITRGAGPMLGDLDLDPGMDSAAFAGQLIGLVAMAIPEAEDEAMEFIQFMVVPADLIDRPMSKADKQHNADAETALREELQNPEIEDTLGIIVSIIRNEAGNIQSLGKRIGVMLPMSFSLGN